MKNNFVKARRLLVEAMEDRICLSVSAPLPLPTPEAFLVEADVLSCVSTVKTEQSTTKEEIEPLYVEYTPGIDPITGEPWPAYILALGTEDTTGEKPPRIRLPDELFFNSKFLLCETSTTDMMASTQSELFSEQQLPFVSFEKIQDGLISSDGEVLQNIVVEFTRIVDQGSANSLEQPLTVYFEVTSDRVSPLGTTIEVITADESIHQINAGGRMWDSPIQMCQMTFQPGEIEVQWVHEISSQSYFDQREFHIWLTDSKPMVLDYQPEYTIDMANNKIDAKVLLHEATFAQQPPITSATCSPKAVTSFVGYGVQKCIAEQLQTKEAAASQFFNHIVEIDTIFQQTGVEQPQREPNSQHFTTHVIASRPITYEEYCFSKTDSLDSATNSQQRILDTLFESGFSFFQF